MADDSYVVEVSSANALPAFKEISVKKIAVSPAIITVGSSENPVISGEIIVRGDLTQTVKVPIDLRRERIIQQNLLANRGVIQTETTDTHEG